MMNNSNAGRMPYRPLVSATLAVLFLIAAQPGARGQDQSARGASSYDSISPVLQGKETLRDRMAKDQAEKAGITARQRQLLESRYDLASRPDAQVKMSRGKPIQVGPATRLPEGLTWEGLALMPPEEVRLKDLFPKGYLPLTHPKQETGGVLLPQMVTKQFPRLERFDVEFDLPEHFLPEFPPAIYLTTRPDLGDVSQGKVVTDENFQEIFAGILNPKDLEGLRLLVTQFPAMQFNATADRKTVNRDGMRGLACFDCHTNGHTNGAAHLGAEARPQAHRRRLEAPSLRGVNIQRLFGSQRAMKTVEDFTEFEQRAAYFDGDPVIATAKGVNPLERGSQVQFMAEMQELLDFPPAPGLDLFGKLDPAKFGSNSSEMRGQDLFFGKAKCATCHPAPYYTDNLMHNLRVERFYKPQTINGFVATVEGPIKTFPLRGIKESPPYLHDGRLLTLEDATEFFNLLLELKLTDQEKSDLVAFLRQL